MAVTMNSPFMSVRIGRQGDRGNVFFWEPGVGLGFNVAYTNDGTPPKAEIDIYNPPLELAKSLRDAPTEGFVEITAGISEDYVSRLFVGAPARDGIALTTGTDWRLSVKAISGGARYRSVASQQTLPGGGSLEQQVREAIRRAGCIPGTLDVPKIRAKTISFSGPWFRLLEKLAARAGRRLVYDGEVVSFIRVGRGIPQPTTLIPVFSSADLNLVSDVTITPDGLQATVLLAPDLRPGKQYILEYNDPYENSLKRVRCVARNVQHRLEVHGNDATTQLLGRIYAE